jgi:hypothetical protein
MFRSFTSVGAGALIAVGIAFGGGSADAQSVMKQCGDQWKAAKAAGTTNGLTWPQFLAQCREQQKNAGIGGGTAPAPSSAAPASTAPFSRHSARACGDEEDREPMRRGV